MDSPTIASFPKTERSPVKIYQAINAVQSELVSQGISKANRNAQQGYKFRGIDDVYNALSPLLSKHGLCILPRMISRNCQERTNAKGTALFYVTVEAEFDLVAVEDGSKHIIRTFGEAMDSGDKATNKAMSAAYKYACLQAFSIPTEGDNDADATTHEVSQNKPQQDAKPKATPEQSAARIEKGVASGMALEAAAHLATLQKPELDAVWPLLKPETQNTLVEAWPK
jgi:hypothetical protein